MAGFVNCFVSINATFVEFIIILRIIGKLNENITIWDRTGRIQWDKSNYVPCYYFIL